MTTDNGSRVRQIRQTLAELRLLAEQVIGVLDDLAAQVNLVDDAILELDWQAAFRQRPAVEGVPVTADRLPIHCHVKVSGDWFTFEGLSGDVMLLRDANLVGVEYHVSAGEVFEWADLF